MSTQQLRYFSTFSGIGGFEIGIHNAYSSKSLPTIIENRQGRNGSTNKRGDDVLSGHQPPLCVGYSEIDKYAISVYERQFNGTPNFGDITKINADELPDFDCLVGGFPCQAFSIAGKRGGFEDTRGTLFFDLARILRAKQPRLFVFENVKGLLSSRTNVTFDAIIEVVYKETTENIWQTSYDKKWEIIADNLSVYLQKTGTISGLLKNSKSLLDQSLQIMRKENFLTEDEMLPLELSEEEWALLHKQSCSTDNLPLMDTSWLEGMVATNAEIVSSLENIMAGVLAAQKLSTTSTDSNMTTDLRTCISAIQEQNITLFMLKQSISSGSLWKKILSNLKKEGTYYVKTFNVIINAIDELGYDCQWQVLNSKNHGVPQNRERIIIVGHLRGTPRPKVFPLTGTDNKDIVQLNHPTHSNDRVYDQDGISPTLNTMQGGNRQPFISEPPKIRRLTPVECERLQAFPDDWTKYGEDEHGVRVPISDTQRYKMCGNAVTTNVIRDVFERIL